MRPRTYETSANTAASPSRWRRLFSKNEHCLVDPDRIDETGEQRWHALGKVHIEREEAAVLLVVHAYREDRYGEEVIRTISAEG
jgi:uncharacterized DUF497 family protein